MRWQSRWLSIAVCVVAAVVGNAQAQTGAESGVGYIDSALPSNMFRLRADFAYDYPFPDRGEFIYSRSRGLPGGSTETRANVLDFSAAAEVAFSSNFSVFTEVPFRFLDPTLNGNAAGFSDLSFGFKYALLNETESATTSFQFRVYAPTGNVPQHLGRGFVVAEPALLNFIMVEELTLESELRFWIPIGGDDFPSHVVRYGVGASYKVWESGRRSFAPVVEVVGWTFLDGKKAVNGPDGVARIVGAGGDTIVNLKLGTRFRTEMGDFYLGYAMPVSGETFYRDLFRAEYRIFW